MPKLKCIIRNASILSQLQGLNSLLAEVSHDEARRERPLLAGKDLIDFPLNALFQFGCIGCKYGSPGRRLQLPFKRKYVPRKIDLYWWDIYRPISKAMAGSETGSRESRTISGFLRNLRKLKL